MKQGSQSFRKQVTYWFSIAIVGIIVGIGLQFVQAAWTNPASVAPGGNVAGPINTGNIDQTKSAGLGLTGNLVVGGKARSASTVESDSGSTLVTKDYIGNATVYGGGQYYQRMSDLSYRGCRFLWGNATCSGGYVRCPSGYKAIGVHYGIDVIDDEHQSIYNCDRFWQTDGPFVCKAISIQCVRTSTPWTQNN